MRPFARPTTRASLLLILLVVGLVLPSCDFASAGNTAILNANSTVPPTVRHRFEYEESDAAEGGAVEVISTIESDDLDAILSRNGFSRSDVVSARVDSVRVEPISAASLTAADLYLGIDDTGPRIAEIDFPSGAPPAVDRRRRSVIGAVKAGASRVFARFQVDDPSSIPSGGGRVRAIVHYRLEVGGV